MELTAIALKCNIIKYSQLLSSTTHILPTATEVLLPADTGFIRPEGNEKTYRLKQRDIINEVDMNTAKNAMDFQLTKFGPYNLNYSKNGRYLLINVLSVKLF